MNYNALMIYGFGGCVGYLVAGAHGALVGVTICLGIGVVSFLLR